MKKQIMTTLLALIRNPRDSSHKLSGETQFSQPTVFRHLQEIFRNGIAQVVTIPNMAYLDYEIVVFNVIPETDMVNNALQSDPAVIFAIKSGEGQIVAITRHKTFSDYLIFRRRYNIVYRQICLTKPKSIVKGLSFAIP